MLGTTVSQYEIIKKLGEGGMGIVYQARDRTLSRLVALKFLHARLVDSAEQVARFEQEARAISALNHPNIATIYGFEQAGEHKFLVLEYLPGGTLAAKLAELKSAGGKLPIEQALDYAIQIAEGLKHAHDHGVVHRDIKASNAMFTNDGRLKITDFGLARLTGDEHTTQSGNVMGTPPSMSPEQAQGKPTDERSDIFSFGILLYQLFAGEMPFRAANAVALMHQIVYDEPPPLARTGNAVPDAVQQVVSKALEKEPGRRYQSVGDLLDHLRAVREGTGLRRSGSGSLEETVTIHSLRPVRRRLWIGAVVLATLLAGALIVPTLRERAMETLHPRRLPQEKRIAVLPFSTGDAANQAFSDGLNDIISYKLAQLEQFQGSLLVVPGSEVNGRGVKTPSGARDFFGANLAIVGTVVRTGDQFQAMVSLVDTRKLVQLRSATIETRFSEITSFRDRVISRIAQMLELELTAQAQRTLGAGETSVSTAYTSYIEGRGYLQRRELPGNLDKAIRAFQESLAKDPKYALAYAGIAEALFRRFQIDRDPQIVDDALTNCVRAVELNDELEPVHITMGLIKSAKGDYEGAEAEFRRVLALNPVNPEAHSGLAETFELRSRMNEAEAAYKTAINLRPNDWAGYNRLGNFYFNQSCLVEAEPYYQKVEQLAPDNYLAYMNLGATYIEVGRHADAIVVLQKALTLNPDNARIYSNLGMAYFFQRQYAEAAQWHERAIEHAPNSETYWGNLAHARRWDPNLATRAPDAFRKAIDLGERAVINNPRDARLHARLAEYWAALGEKRNSLAAIARAEALAEKSAYVQYRAALVHEQAGDRRRALRSVRFALELGYSLEETQKDPVLKNLREDDRYRQLLETRRSTGHNTCSLQH